MWSLLLAFLLRRSGTAFVLGLVFLPAWGFWRVAAVALLIQLPPNLLVHFFSTSVPTDFLVDDENQEMTEEQHRRIRAQVAEVAALAGIEPPAVWFTRSVPKSAVAGIFERTLTINPSVYNALSKRARRALIAHEIAHRYDQASRERLAADLAIFIPTGIASAAILLSLFGRMPVDENLVGYVAISILGRLIYAKLSRINERQADLLAADILGEKESMLALCRELSRRPADRRKHSWPARVLSTHPTWQRRRVALEKHDLRPHPRRVARLVDRLAGLVLELALVSVLAVLVYWLLV